MPTSTPSSVPDVASATVAPAGDAPVAVDRPGWAKRRLRRLGHSRVLRRLRRNKVALVAAAFLVFLALVAVFRTQIAPYDPNAVSADILASPSADHLLGTDALGRDTLSRLVFATRITLLASVQAVGLGVLLGVPFGLLAGFRGGAADAVFSRIFDALLSLPPVVFALAIIGILGPGLTNAMIAVGIVIAPRFFRVSRVASEAVRNDGYIEACRAIGVSTSRILWRHVLPNASGPLLVQASFAAGLAISVEASLSFLGLGVQLPTASWGSMFRTAFNTVSRNVFQLVPPGLMITLTVLAMFALGDAVRDALGRNSSGS